MAPKVRAPAPILGGAKDDDLGAELEATCMAGWPRPPGFGTDAWWA